MTAPELIRWRRRIDQLDAQLLQLWNRRAALADAVRDWKRKSGVPNLDPERELEIIGRARDQNPGPLDADAVGRLFETLLGELKRNAERREAS